MTISLYFLWIVGQMQSFLQYRRFRDAVQAQIERDKERAQRRTLGDEGDDTGGAHSPSSQDSKDSKIDVEKGEGLHETPVVTHEIDEGPNGTAGAAANRNYSRTQNLEPTEEKPEDTDEDEDDDDFELGGQARSNLSRTTTQQSAGTALGTTLSGIEVRKRTTVEGGDGNVFVVGYESADDPNDPHNWSFGRRLGCTVPIAMVGASN